jgi:plasmid maintenance system antidote protein VapI
MRVTEIVRGKRTITTDTALVASCIPRLSRARRATP